MPELPEVETICQGIRPLLIGQRIARFVVRCAALRWPVPVDVLQQVVPGATFQQVVRRGKYLLLSLEQGWLIVHLGMSGRLQVLPDSPPPGKHDHLEWQLATGGCLRFTDPRRFGALLWTTGSPYQHPLLVHLGPEPLSDDFHVSCLRQQARGRRVPIKLLLMDSHVVAGIGNIYASEILFHAALHPTRPASSLSAEEWQRLVDAIRETLQLAIAKGGTTVKDFRHADGTLGYFQQELQVYGRQDQPCRRCDTPLVTLRLGGRASCCCPSCQR